MNWNAIRAEFSLDPTVLMLNSGSFGPTPAPVRQAVAEFREMLAAGPTNFFLRQAPPHLWQSRCRTAEFLGTTPEQLVFTTNVSVAVNIVAQSLMLAAPGEILMSDHEYGAMEWTWQRAAARQGLSIRTFEIPHPLTDPVEIVRAAEAAMTPRTRLLFFSHVISPTGLILPAKELCTLARGRGIVTIIDGAHAPAMLPLNIRDVGADYYCGNLHKWLLAPIGAGFLVAAPGLLDRLQPLCVSWGYRPDAFFKPDAVSTHPDAPDEYGSTFATRFLEFDGTRDIAPWLAVPSAIDFQANIGWDVIRARQRELGADCVRKLRESCGLEPSLPRQECFTAAMTAFLLPPGVPAQVWREAFWKHRIEVAINGRCGRVHLRLSHHIFTLPEEIDAFVAAWPKVQADVG